MQPALGRNPAENPAFKGLRGFLEGSAEGREAKSHTFYQVWALLLNLGSKGERRSVWGKHRDEVFLGQLVPWGF